MSSIEEELRKIMNRSPGADPFTETFDPSLHSLEALRGAIDALEAGTFGYGITSGPQTVEVGDKAEFSVALLNPGGAVIPASAITPGTYTIYRIRDGVKDQIYTHDAVAADGRVELDTPYEFASADWSPGDLFMVVFSGIQTTIGATVTYYPDMILTGRVVREEEIISVIGSKHATTDAGVDDAESKIKTDVASKHTTTDALIASKHATTDANIDDAESKVKTDIASKHSTTQALISSKHATTDANVDDAESKVKTDIASKHTITDTLITSKHATTDANVDDAESKVKTDIASKHSTTDALISSKHATTQSKIETVYNNIGEKGAGYDVLTRLGAFTNVQNLRALLGGFDEINTLWDSLGGYDKDDPLKKHVDYIEVKSIPTNPTPKTINAYVQAIGSNDADNDFASDLVQPNEDGSVLERLEHLKTLFSGIPVEFTAQPAQPVSGVLNADPTVVSDTGSSSATAYGDGAVVKSYVITPGVSGATKYVYVDLSWEIAGTGANPRSKWMVCAGDTFVFADAVDLTDEVSGTGTFHRAGQIKLPAMDNVPFTIALLVIVDSGSVTAGVRSETELRVSLTLS